MTTAFILLLLVAVPALNNQGDLATQPALVTATAPSTSTAPMADPTAPRSIITPEAIVPPKLGEPVPTTTLTSQLIPTPGAVGLFGLGLLAMSRRKRG